MRTLLTLSKALYTYRIYAFTILFLCLLNSCSTLSTDEYLKQSQEKGFISQEKQAFIQISEDLKLRYVKSGRGQPLVMIHHVRGQLEYFDKIKPELEKHYTLYLVDLPGHGASSIPDTTYTAQFYKETLYRFIEKLNLREAIFLGESIGASLVLSLTTYKDLHPKAIIAINPYDGENGIENGNGFASFLIWTFKTPLSGMTSSIRAKGPFRKVLKGGFYDPEQLQDTLVDTYLMTGKRKGHRKAFVSTIKNFDSFSEFQKDYEIIACPTLIVHGESDWLPIDVRETFFEGIPDLQRVTIPKTGHFASREKPNDVVRLVLDFLEVN